MKPGKGRVVVVIVHQAAQGVDSRRGEHGSGQSVVGIGQEPAEDAVVLVDDMIDARDVLIDHRRRGIIDNELHRGADPVNVRIQRREFQSRGIEEIRGNLIVRKWLRRCRIRDHNLRAGFGVDDPVEIAGQLLRSRDRQRFRRSHDLTPAFIVEEKLRPVFLDRAHPGWRQRGCSAGLARRWQTRDSPAAPCCGNIHRRSRETNSFLSG